MYRERERERERGMYMCIYICAVELLPGPSLGVFKVINWAKSKLLTAPSLGVFKVINWAKSKLLTGPRTFSHYKNRVSGDFFSVIIVCVFFFLVPNDLATF